MKKTRLSESLEECLEEWKRKFDGAWDYDILGNKRQIFISKTAFEELKQKIQKIIEKGDEK